MSYVRKTKFEMIKLGMDRALEENMKVIPLWNTTSFIVVNEDETNSYQVDTIDYNGKTIVENCTCPHHVNRKVTCKHMFAVAKNKELSIII